MQVWGQRSKLTMGMSFLAGRRTDRGAVWGAATAGVTPETAPETGIGGGGACHKHTHSPQCSVVSLQHPAGRQHHSKRSKREYGNGHAERLSTIDGMSHVIDCGMTDSSGSSHPGICDPLDPKGQLDLYVG